MLAAYKPEKWVKKSADKRNTPGKHKAVVIKTWNTFKWKQNTEVAKPT